jgi:hypothetical protein
MSSKTAYTNVPYSDKKLVDSTVQSFNSFYSNPIELHAGELNAITAFFTSKDFDSAASQAIAVIIMTQSKKDGYNPMQVLDTLKGYEGIEISAFVSTMLNFNRYKTSFLGYSFGYSPVNEVARNIKA